MSTDWVNLAQTDRQAETLRNRQRHTVKTQIQRQRETRTPKDADTYRDYDRLKPMLH